MLSRDYFQKLDSLNNELDMLTDRMKKVSEEIRRMHEMKECPRCFQIFYPEQFNGQLCSNCVEYLEEKGIK